MTKPKKQIKATIPNNIKILCPVCYSEDIVYGSLKNKNKCNDCNRSFKTPYVEVIKNET